MEQPTTEELPVELQKGNYDYPARLFADIMRFDGSDDIHIKTLVAENERPITMARYAVAKALRLSCAEERLFKIARLEIEHHPTFVGGIRKIRNSWWSGDVERGDIELKADELGVYELLFPFEDEKVLKAERDEQGLHEGLVPVA